MKNISQKESIEKFIKELKSKYDIRVDYIYDEDEDLFDIWHYKKELQFEKNFLEFVGRLLKEIIYSQGIYNVSFGYDYTKTIGYYNSYFAQEKIILGTNTIIKMDFDDNLKGFLDNYSTRIIKKERFFDIENNTKVYYSQYDVSKYNDDFICFDKDKKSTVINTNLINTLEKELAV